MSDDEDPIGSGDGYDNSGGVFDTTADELDEEHQLEQQQQQEGRDKEDGLDITGDEDGMIVNIDEYHGGDPSHGATTATAPSERVTSRYLTQFERARVLGTRA